MRDPARIPIVTAKLAQVWEMYPDMRLGQLIVNALGADPFFLEDDRVEQRLDDMLANPPWRDQGTSDQPLYVDAGQPAGSTGDTVSVLAAELTRHLGRPGPAA